MTRPAQARPDGIWPRWLDRLGRDLDLPITPRYLVRASAAAAVLVVGAYVACVVYLLGLS